MSRAGSRSVRRAGLTLVELLVALGLTGLVLASLNSVLQALAGTYRSGTARMSVDAVGSRAMRRVHEAFRTAALETLVGLPEAPLWATAFEYRRSLGYDGAATAWSAPESLRYAPADGSFEWVLDAGEPDERVAFRCGGVAPLLAGEEPNGLDDNGNGLIDEPGFCATRRGTLLSVWLTLAGEDHEGRPIERTWSTTVRCRN